VTYSPCILIHNPLAFQLAFHKEKIHKCLLEILNTTLQLLKLNWAAFLLRHIHGFSYLLVHRFSQPKRQFEIEQRLWNSTVPRKCRCHGKEFRSLTSHPELVYSMKTGSGPLWVLWYSCFIPRLNFLVRYSSDPSAGIFFVCEHAGRTKDPRCENWNCQLLARSLHPQTKIQIVFRKLLQYHHWSCFSLRNKRLYFWLWIARHC